MKRYLLIISLASIAAIHYAAINANIGDVVGSAVDTATDVVDTAVGGPIARTETVEEIRPVSVISEPVEPAVVTETSRVVEEPAIEEPPVVVHRVAPASTETVVYTEDVPHHRGWFRNMWYQLTGR